MSGSSASTRSTPSRRCNGSPRQRGVEYELLRDPERTFTNEIGVVAFPVTLFVDTDGQIVRQTGEIDAGELRDLIDELF